MSSSAVPTSTSGSRAPEHDCTACGACCFSELPEYVRVFGCDLERMDERAQRHVHFIGNRCYMRLEGGRCSALEIDPSRRTFRCSIYEMRPDVCRALEPNSSACLAELDAKAERPLIAVEALLRQRGPVAGA